MSRKRIALLVAPCFTVGLLLLLLAAADPSTAAQGGQCAVPGGYGTIQAAVDDPGCEIIDVAAGTFAENINITRTVTIQGQGALSTTVDGSGSGVVFTIQSGAVVTLTGLTIANGSAPDGGGIYNAGTATVNNSTLSGNSSTGDGGAIFNDNGAMVTVNSSTLSGNSGGFGGVIYNSGGTAVFNNSIVTGNSAGAGGGLYNYSNYMEVNNSTVSGNMLGGSALNSILGGSGGGGIHNDSGTLAVNNSTISNNMAGLNRGGGIQNDGTLTITNSTLSGNSTDERGGGIFISFQSTVVISNSTLSGNSADTGGGIRNEGGTVNFANTILANNTAVTEGPDCWGGLTSLDYNLVEDTANCTIAGSTANNIYGQDPMLGPLGDNGGSTWTQALGPDSPAVDAGNCPGATADQRGFPRPVDVPFIPDVADGCDIGAFEFQNEWLVFLPAVFRQP